MKLTDKFKKVGTSRAYANTSLYNNTEISTKTKTDRNIT